MTDLSLTETIQHAKELLRDERHEENLAFLTEAVERFPKDPEVRLLYGTLLVMFRPEDAAWEIATAISFDTTDPYRLTRAAQMLYVLGEFDAAQDYVDWTLDAAPDDFALLPALLNVGGKLAARRGDDEMADAALRRAVEREPDNPHFAQDLEEYLNSR
jgi:Flp pilus assembly protein TadD